MTTFGWVLIFAAFLIARSGTKGRGVTDVPGDVGDLVVAAIQGDYAEVQAVLNRTGENTSPVGASKGVSTIDKPTSGSGTGQDVLAEMRRLGAGKTYVLGATGPDSYDCSGLLWRAMSNVGAYTGPRFTTSTWGSAAQAAGAVRVSDPRVGDVVLWPGHIGVVDGNDSVFSALSPQSGIKSVSITGISSQKGASPTFWRLPDKGSATAPAPKAV